MNVGLFDLAVDLFGLRLIKLNITLKFENKKKFKEYLI